MTIKAIACDYDRTLTDENLVTSEAALDALNRLRAEGIKVIVVSGRNLPFLLELQKAWDFIDAIVAENGAIAYFFDEGDGDRKVTFGDTAITRAFDGAEFTAVNGEVIVGVVGTTERAIQAFADAHDIAVDIEQNIDSFMVMPKGVNKSTGLQHVIDHYGIRNDELAAVGDGENDIALFAAAGFSAAVANAVPELKAKASYVCKNAYGEGVAEFAEVILAKNADSA